MSKLFSDETLAHYGTKDMKWGYNDGKLNGKRRAGQGVKSPSEVTSTNPNYVPLDLDTDIKLAFQELGESLVDRFFGINFYDDKRNLEEKVKDPLGISDSERIKFAKNQYADNKIKDYWRSQKYKAIRQKLQNLPITEPYSKKDEEYIKNYK